jgi:hypothetical protein
VNDIPPGSGILFSEQCLYARVGAEAVALLIDPEADGLLGARLDLNLKAGIAPTPYGPIMFLIWWVPPFVDGPPGRASVTSSWRGGDSRKNTAFTICCQRNSTERRRACRFGAFQN